MRALYESRLRYVRVRLEMPQDQDCREQDDPEVQRDIQREVGFRWSGASHVTAAPLSSRGSRRAATASRRVSGLSWLERFVRRSAGRHQGVTTRGRAVRDDVSRPTARTANACATLSPIEGTPCRESPSSCCC